ncbi:MAG: hypothetical protein LBI13_03765 [Streptococcaceae bacterium]|jgi:histidinol dehydrogenase|nr:hypothetical protein [Streptococcaceae bacterium]
MTKKDKLIEKQQEEQRELQKDIQRGEEALEKFKQQFNLIEDTSYNLSKNLKIIGDEELQNKFSEIHRSYEEDVHTANREIDDLYNKLAQMKKEHEVEIEKLEE